MTKKKWGNLLFAGLLSIWVIGCGQNAKWPETTSKSEASAQTQRTFPEKYNDYLLLMEPEQRARFFRLEMDGDRERFIQGEGIQQKKYLNDHLTVGMSSEKVEELLSRPMVSDVDMTPQGKKMQWVYSHFNGFRNIKYIVIFQNNRLTEWKVCLPQ